MPLELVIHNTVPEDLVRTWGNVRDGEKRGGHTYRVEYDTFSFVNYVTVEITNQCNLACLDFCLASAKKGSAKEGLDNSINSDFISELARFLDCQPTQRYPPNIEIFNATHVAPYFFNKTFCISGGEPTLNSHLYEYLKILKKELNYPTSCPDGVVWDSNTLVVLTTNLTNCTDDFFEKIKEVEPDFFVLQFPYDAAHKKEFKKIVEGEYGYEDLKDKIPPLINFKGKPEDALLTTLKYAISCTKEYKLKAIVRVTKNIDEDFSELTHLQLQKFRHSESILNGDWALNEQFKDRWFPTQLYKAPILSSGYAKQKKGSLDVFLRSQSYLLTDGLYIDCDGRAWPNPAYRDEYPKGFGVIRIANK